MKIHSCGNPRAPPDPADIVELNFADTSAISVVDAFGLGRMNGRTERNSRRGVGR